MFAVDVSMKSEDDQIDAIVSMAGNWRRLYGRRDMWLALLCISQRLESHTLQNN